MRTITGCLIILLSACSPGAGSGAAPQDVRLDVEPEAASPGDSVMLTLASSSTAPVGYNLCTSELERRTDGGWAAVPSDRVCTMELRTLQPQNEEQYAIQLPADLSAGDYRFRTSVENLDTGERGTVQSESFHVEP